MEGLALRNNIRSTLGIGWPIAQVYARRTEVEQALICGLGTLWYR